MATRRLENIPTGFIDYGAAGQGLLTGIQQGRNMLIQEEERQRRLDETENQRIAVADQIYRANQADVERFGKDLTTQEKLKFTNQFDEIIGMNRGIQDFLLKGGKPNSPEYRALQDNMEKRKKTVQMNIEALKEVKDSMSQAAALQKSGFEGFDNDVIRLNQSYNQILNGQYIPSTDIPNKTTITQNAYLAPSKVIESYVPKISMSIQDHVVKDSKNKIIRTEKKQIPVYTDLETSAYDIMNAPAVQSSGVLNNFIESKKLNNDGIKPQYQARYDLYKMYMKEIDKPAKDIKEFEPQDYAMMELLARKYKPAPDQTEKFYQEKQGGGGSGSSTAVKTAEMQQMINDLFSGNPKKSNAVLDKLKGALKSKNWNINLAGGNVSAKSSGNEYDPNPKEYSFGLIKNDENVATAKAMINAYFGTIGSAGVKVK